MAAAEQPQNILVSEDSSWDDKLDSYIDAEFPDKNAEPEDEKVELEAEAEQTEDESPEEDKDETEPELITIRHNGKDVKLSADEVIDLSQKGFDYTQKTQELAEERKNIAALAQNVQQQYQLQQQTIQQTAQLYAMDSQLANYQNVNWSAWTDSDPIEAQKGWQQYQILKSQRDEVDRSIQHIQTQFTQQTQAQLATQLRAGAEELAREIKGWSPELAKQLKSNAASNYGFSDAELDSVVDPRMVKVLHDAYKWRELQGKKPEVTKRVAEATKSVKPTGKAEVQSDNRAKLLKQLKSSNSRTARRAIADTLLDKFV